MVRRPVATARYFLLLLLLLRACLPPHFPQSPSVLDSVQCDIGHVELLNDVCYDLLALALQLCIDCSVTQYE